MISGVRLTQLAHGEPLLGIVSDYKDETGTSLTRVEYAEKRLHDLFYYAKQVGFNFIIDTITPNIDNFQQLNLSNMGYYGEQWTFERRMELYQRYSEEIGIEVLLEIDFPTIITTANVYPFADFFINQIVAKYNWVNYWQIMVLPEIAIGNKSKCGPELYIKFLRYIYPKVKLINNNIRLGGPGVYQAVIDYVNTNSGWLMDLINNDYDNLDGDNTSDINYSGFLDLINFFTIYGRQDTDAMNYSKFPEIINKLNN
jgi:hypothetical protein